MSPEELTAHLSNLGEAADVVEAIDDPARQCRRGWNLSGWTYELIPWGVRFVYRGEAAVIASVRPAGPQVLVTQSAN